MRTLVLKVLDQELTFGNQRPRIREELYLQVCSRPSPNAESLDLISLQVLSAYPTFEKYEDYWPVWFYCAVVHTELRRKPRCRCRACRVPKARSKVQPFHKHKQRYRWVLTQNLASHRALDVEKAS